MVFCSWQFPLPEVLWKGLGCWSHGRVKRVLERHWVEKSKTSIHCHLRLPKQWRLWAVPSPSMLKVPCCPTQTSLPQPPWWLSPLRVLGRGSIKAALVATCAHDSTSYRNLRWSDLWKYFLLDSSLIPTNSSDSSSLSLLQSKLTLSLSSRVPLWLLFNSTVNLQQMSHDGQHLPASHNLIFSIKSHRSILIKKFAEGSNLT